MAQLFVADIEFNKLLSGVDDIDLVRLMLEFAADAHADVALDSQHCLETLIHWGSQAAELVAGLGASATTLERLAAVSRYLYVEVGLSGNRDAYYDPANSHLPAVVERRVGIPISLGIVYMHVAEQAGLAVYGVPTPGHFMLGCRGHDHLWYIDPFEAGNLLDADACRARIEGMLDTTVALDADCFRPASAAQIALRVLRNLKAAYAMADRWREALPVQQRLALLLPDELSEQRDLGLIYLRTNAPRPAADLLQRYSDACSPAERTEIESYLRAARRMLAELN